MNRADTNFLRSLWKHRELWWQLSKREVQGRYRGSVLGWGWSLITPLLMLTVYTFVFSQVFRARWGTHEQGGSIAFAINLFAGLITFSIFAETMNQSPGLIVGNSNLATKVVFPLELLSAVTVSTATFHALTSMVVLVTFELVYGLAGGSIFVPPTLIWLPLVWLPLLSSCLALSWIVSALGVFARDLSQATGVAVNLLMFLSAVFYPLSALPERWQPLLKLNPIAMIIEETRNVMVTGSAPNIMFILTANITGLLLCEASFRSFQSAKRAFADVL